MIYLTESIYSEESNDNSIRKDPKTMRDIYNFSRNLIINDSDTEFGLLSKFIRYFGIINFDHKKKHSSTCFVNSIIPIILHLFFAEYLYITFKSVNEEWFDWKVDITYTISYALRLVTWHFIRLKSQIVIELIQKIQCLSKPAKKRKINIIIVVITVIVFAYAPTITSICTIYDGELHFSYALHGANFEQDWLRSTLFFLKSLFTDCLPRLTETLILILYLVLCHKLSIAVMDFTKHVDALPVDAFMDSHCQFIKKHSTILDAIESLQSAFSLISLCLCSYYILLNFCKLSSFLLFDVKQLNGPLIFDHVYCIIFINISLYALFYFAGKIPSRMDKLKNSVYKKLASGTTDSMLGEDRVNLLVIHQIVSVPKTVLSGCELLDFTKKNLLAVFGALMTYGLLLVQLNRQT